MSYVISLLKTFYDCAFYSPFRNLQRFLRERRLRTSICVTREEIISVFSLLAPRQISQTLIRIGALRDGGYVLPSDCFDADALFSPGVGLNSSFELEFARRGVPCFLIDASVREPRQGHEKFSFQPLYLGAKTAGAVISLDDWLSRENHDKSTSLVLQIDIEGAEWDVLKNIDPQTLAQFKIITIELHNLHEAPLGGRFEDIKISLEKLLVGHLPVWLNPNNFEAGVDFQGLVIPPVCEVTFVRRDYYADEGAAGLDSHTFLNNPRLPNLELDPELFGIGS